MKRIYQVVPNGDSSITTEAQAQKVGEFLERKFGDDPITPEQYVASARPSRSPLHSTLEWDNDKAAHQHRLNQARGILRSIVVVTNPDLRVQPRAYHSVSLLTTEGARRAYVPRHIVWAKADLAEQVVAAALHELRTWTAKYADYKDQLDAIRDAAGHVDLAKEALVAEA